MHTPTDLAVEAAKADYPKGIWEQLSPGERTAAVYREIRRMDAESAQKALASEGKPSAEA